MTLLAGTDAPVVAPGDLTELRDVIRDTHGALLVAGGGTKLDWGTPPTACDAVVSTRGLSGVVRHDPGDATATVRAGTPLAEVDEVVRAHGQWLATDAFDGAPVATSTVGGVFAADDHGPRRLRHGTLRDLVIGATLVLADGTIARTGGQVIKNVAGYDLAKLACGSLGTLAVVADVTVRLHPRPASTLTVAAPIEADRSTVAALALLAAPVEPAAVVWVDAASAADVGLGADSGTLLVRFDGGAQAVEAQAAAAGELLGRYATGARERFGAERAQAVWPALVAQRAGARAEMTVRAATRPDQLGVAAAALERAAADAGVQARMASDAALGLHDAVLAGGAVASYSACVRAWRSQLAPIGGHVVVRRRPPELDDSEVVWGPPPAAVALMRRVKDQFDPDRRLAPGRFVAGL